MDKFFLKTEDNINIAINHIKHNHKEVVILVHGWFMTKDNIMSQGNFDMKA